MSTITIRVTSSAKNPDNVTFGQQPDQGMPSYLDMHVSNSTDPVIVNGVYDVWCLNPVISISTANTAYVAETKPGNDLASYTSLGISGMTVTKLNQLSWLLAQNFTADPKFGGQFNFGEVQMAIWELLGFTQAQIDATHPDARFLTDNFRHVVERADIDFLKAAAVSAIASGVNVLPVGTFFSTVIDPNGNIQPLISQLQKAKLGNYVWLDEDYDGVQDAGEQGINNVIVELYDGAGNLIATTKTGDDFSTAAVEKGYYQFTGLNAGDYKVKFISPAELALTLPDAVAATDATDSDGNTTTGFTTTVTLAAGESNQTLDAGLVKYASLGDYVWVDGNNDGQQNDGAASGMNGVTVNLYKGDGSFVATTVTANDGGGNAGYYKFTNLLPGDYKVEFIKPAGYAFAQQDVGADGSDSDASTTTGITTTTTLVSGENDLTWDAGLVKLASLGDYVWEDMNYDGQQNEAVANGVSGVTVKLYTGAGALVGTTSTDSTGYYKFVDLLPGDYKVEFIKPAGYAFTKQDIGADGTDSDADTTTGVTTTTTLSSGENDLTWDAGLIKLASLGDYVWEDMNYDGQQNEAAANGVSGVTVKLYTAADVLVGTTTTDSTGYYKFIDLVPGDYKVEFVKPAGYSFTKQDIGADGSDSDADTTTGITTTTTLVSGENDLTWDAGLIKLASLGDYVWEDMNYDGQQNEAAANGVSGVTVNLYTGAGALVGTTATDSTGYYKFVDLVPGDYKVEVIKPAGYSFTKQDIGADSSDSDVDTTTGITTTTTLVSGENDLTWDAGLIKLASLGDYVWEDMNYDGQQNEAVANGVSGVTVKLYTGAGALVGTTSTDSTGYYKFVDLVPGDYKVEFVKPAGYAFTKQDIGADGSDSDADTTTGITTTTTLVSGENDLTWDAGLIKLASLGDYVWVDANLDGKQNDGASSGLNGVTVKLYKGDGSLVGTTVTANDGGGNAGYYKFVDLVPGDYKVEFTKPAGYIFTQQDQGADDGADSDANTATGATTTTTLVSGENDLSWDAGLIKLASLGDYVWADNNLDGKQNDGATSGINGVTVNLRKPDGTLVASTVTANDGSSNPGYYKFVDLVPGDYKVEFIKPTGYAFTAQDQGADDNADSDANVGTGQTTTTTLVSGENDLSWDAGMYQLASIGDYVWVDTNADGQQNDGATSGMNGVTVKLYTASGALVGTTNTANDGGGNAGYYKFTGLVPGDYKVEFVKPAGYNFAAKDVGADTSDSDADTTTGMTAVTTLTAGENDLTWDAGLVKFVPPPEKASLGDYVWVDCDGNGKQDDGASSGLNGVTVKLYKADGSLVGTKVTANDASGSPGYYKFTDLTPGDYKVEFVKPAGYAFTQQDVGLDNADSDANVSTGMTAVTTLVAGENDMTWDAGLIKLASLGDYVWVDCDGDGKQDDGSSSGLNGVTVKLLKSDGVTVVATTTTANDSSGHPGYYKFTNLVPGDYKVQFVKPDGYAFTAQNVGTSDSVDSDANTTTGITSTITLSQGENDLRWDAGLIKLASLGDYVWEDKDADGKQDDGASSGVNGVTVKLFKGDGTTLVATTTTANDGSGNPGYYKFSNLTPGDYKVQFIKPTGYTFTAQNATGTETNDSDADTTTGMTGTITLSQGENDVRWDAGLKKVPTTASLGDYVWVDKDCDGKQDDGASSGLNGVTVRLLKADNSVVATTTTANDSSGNPGYYKFINLVPGDYKVEFVKPAGYNFTTANNTGDDNTDSDADVSTGRTATTTLTAGENDLRWDAGLVLKPASIGNYVWEDTDQDGIQDSGENGIANVTVKLLNSAGSVLQSTTTDSTGKYLFDDLNPGDYKIQVVKPSGYTITKQNQGSSDSADSDIDVTTGITAVTTLTAGENDLTWDAGMYKVAPPPAKASVGDKVWDDMDHDNVQDSSEPGIDDVVVKLYTSANVLVGTQKTDNGGKYLFKDLDPGTYYLVFDKTNVQHYNYGTWNNMSDWKWAKKDTGTNDSIDSDVNGDATAKTNVTRTDNFTLVAGQNDMTRDAGITPIVIDLNGDGVQTISRANSGGTFDLFGNGSAVQSGWISGDDGFLAVDSNSNGRIDSISELFGGLNKGDGFAKLAAFDSNGDGIVSAADESFASLLIWKDSNGNHQTDDGELISLTDAGISSLKVSHIELPFLDAQGNVHLERSSATLDDGSTVDMTDVYFNVDAADAAAAGVELVGVNTLLDDSLIAA